MMGGFPPELHPATRRYHEAKATEFDARTALGSIIGGHRVKWWKIDDALCPLWKLKA